MKLCRVFALAALLAPALPLSAMVVGRPGAIVFSPQVMDEGKTIKVKVQFAKTGTYHVAGGYSVDRNAEFQFLKSMAGTKYYGVRPVKVAKDNDVVELTFSLKAVPPLLDKGKDRKDNLKVRVLVYTTEDSIPTAFP